MSRPVALSCDDNQTYVVKSLRTDGPDMRHALTTEHVASRLGKMVGCPIPASVLVEVPAQLIASETRMSHMQPGLGHSVQLLTSCADEKPPGPVRTPQNTMAYAAMAVLYGWFHCGGDHQVIRSTTNQDVYSVDHGLLLQGQHLWNTTVLASAPQPEPDPVFAGHCRNDQIEQALQRLKDISDDAIADVIATVPSQWGVPEADLVALGAYLSQRRDKMVADSSMKGS